MATKRKRTRKRSAVAATRKTTRRRRRVSGVGSTVGSTAVGKRKTRRRRMGATRAGGKMAILKEIAYMTVGAGAGILANNLILRPLENKIAQSMPMAAKFLGGAQCVIGGIIAIRAKGTLGKSFGAAILGGGANTLLRQFNIEKHLPGISGDSDNWQTVKVPINGSEDLQSMVSGLLMDGGAPNWGMVAGESEMGESEMGESEMGESEMGESEMGESEMGESEMGKRGYYGGVRNMLPEGARRFMDRNKRAMRNYNNAPGSGSYGNRIRAMVGEAYDSGILPAKGAY